MGRISKSYRYEIDIIGPDPFSLGELGLLIWKNEKNLCIFNLRTGDRILMKFDI